MSVSSYNRYSTIQNLGVNPLQIKAGGENFPLSYINSIVGFVAPTAAGNYQVVDASGSSIIMPTNIVILAAGIQAPGNTPLVGGTNVSFGLSSTALGNITTAIANTVPTATINAGESVQSTITPSGTDVYLTATSVGTYTSGVAKINILYLTPLVA